MGRLRNSTSFVLFKFKSGRAIGTKPNFGRMKEYLLNIPFILRIRSAIGRYFLDRQLESIRRESKGIPLSDAKRVGILFSGEDEETLKAITGFVNELRSAGKSVRSLGYVSREKAAVTLRTAWNLEFFSQSDLHWYFRPESRHVVSFIEEPFDVLIDLRMRKGLSVPYMVALSNARFKVGCYHDEEGALHDLMIRTDKEVSIAEFIAQVRHYLNMLGQHR